MSKELEVLEVRHEGVIPATPEQVWDGFTKHVAAWLWEVEYEPRVGGAERGLSPDGGIVTAWDPARRFQTRAEGPDGWFNELNYELEPVDGGTRLAYVHRSLFSPEEYDACVKHTALYVHSLGEYVRHFSGREAAYASSGVEGSFAAVRDGLGVAAGTAVGETVWLPDGAKGTVDYASSTFLGVRTDDSLIRVYGREEWGGGVTVAVHLFDASEADTALSQLLDATKAVA